METQPPATGRAVRAFSALLLAALAAGAVIASGVFRESEVLTSVQPEQALPSTMTFTVPSYLTNLTPVFTATIAPSVSMPYLIMSPSDAVRYTKELTGISNWRDSVVVHATLGNAISFTNRVTVETEFADDEVWIVAFESVDVMRQGDISGATGLAYASDEGSELELLAGFTAYLVFDIFGNPFTGGFMDQVDQQGNVIADGVGWQDFFSSIPELP